MRAKHPNSYQYLSQVTTEKSFEGEIQSFFRFHRVRQSATSFGVKTNIGQLLEEPAQKTYDLLTKTVCGLLKQMVPLWICRRDSLLTSDRFSWHGDQEKKGYESMNESSCTPHFLKMSIFTIVL